MKDSPALKWKDLSVAEKIQKSRSIQKSMSDNANFPTPNPKLGDIKAATDNLEAAENIVLDNGGGKRWVNQRNTALGVLDNLISNVVKYVDNIADGDGNIILSAAIPLRRKPTPAERLQKPENFMVKGMDTEGRIRLSWKAVTGKISYRLEMSIDATPLVWQNFEKNITTDNSLEIEALESGKKLWFRICAINSKGEGDWSDPATCRVP